VLREGFGTEHAITYKGEADLVTEIDEEAERVIRGLRSARESRRGGVGVLRKQRIPLTHRGQQRPPG
jgi:fructose-1,6-bisphosphatase/inositol monophosphatase family enzyme